MNRLISYILLGIILFLCNSCTNNLNKLTIDEQLNRPIFHTNTSELNPLTIETESGYDNISDSKQYSVNSTITVNGDKMRTIRFTSLKYLKDDTLQLKIFEENPAYNQSLEIIIVNKEFKSEFSYKLPIAQSNPEFDLQNQELVVKSIPKEKGDSLYGSYSARGICKNGCSETIIIKGDFKAILE